MLWRTDPVERIRRRRGWFWALPVPSASKARRIMRMASLMGRRSRTSDSVRWSMLGRQAGRPVLQLQLHGVGGVGGHVQVGQRRLGAIFVELTLAGEAAEGGGGDGLGAVFEMAA